MLIVDTHTHLYTEEFDADRAATVARALDAGVGKMLLPNINADSVAPMMALCRQWPDVFYPLIGLHPEDVREDWREVLAGMFADRAVADVKQTVQPFVGIGEVGLDFYWDTTYREQQLNAFDEQVRRAVVLGLPLVIHQRAAFTETVEILERYKELHPKGIFHCFGGTVEEAEALLSFNGFLLGIGGTVTYKKSTLPDVLRAAVPIERIVVETDSPYLAPVPHRGKRNESSFIVEIVKKLAEVYALSPADVAAKTAANAYRLFPGLQGRE